jgi:hypothetical protein
LEEKSYKTFPSFHFSETNPKDIQGNASDVGIANPQAEKKQEKIRCKDQQNSRAQEYRMTV